MNDPLSDPSRTPKPGKWAALRAPLGIAAFPVAFVSAFLGIFAVPGTTDSPLMMIYPIYLYLLPTTLVIGGLCCLLPVPAVPRCGLRQLIHADFYGSWIFRHSYCAGRCY